MQPNRRLLCTLVPFAFGFAMLGATIAMAALSKRPVDHFARDPLAVMEGPFYIGFLSNVTVLTWFATAGAAWATAAGLRPAGLNSRGAALMAAASIVTLLGIDDLFMVHEEILQRHAGVSEKITLLAYFVMVVAVGWLFRAHWKQSRWRWVLCAGGFFAASVGVDTFTTGFGWRIILEDGLKFFGIISLLAWVLAIACDWLAPNLRHPGEESMFQR